jgi:diphosphomevalonate decarboxylase
LVHPGNCDLYNVEKQDQGQAAYQASGAAFRETTWESPSNIAIVKYWGKHGLQLPRNPSISMTLSNAKTRTTLRWRSGSGRLLDFKASGEASERFSTRVEQYLDKMIQELPVLGKIDLEVHTSNSFPHSSGIASSASGMSALALGLCSIAAELGELPSEGPVFQQKAGRMARLGSGSACRSLDGPWMAWGKSEAFEGATDDFAITPDQVNPVFKTLRDAILIVDAGQKAISSTIGHSMMTDNPFAEARYANARRRMLEMYGTLKSGDTALFVEIAEAEAMELHALMMTSVPSFILLKPGTLALIEKIRAFRRITSIPICFTLDAGPNLHLLYPESAVDKVHALISDELQAFCADGRVLYDQAGEGPKRLA